MSQNTCPISLTNMCKNFGTARSLHCRRTHFLPEIYLKIWRKFGRQEDIFSCEVAGRCRTSLPQSLGLKTGCSLAWLGFHIIGWDKWSRILEHSERQINVFRFVHVGYLRCGINLKASSPPLALPEKENVVLLLALLQNPTRCHQYPRRGLI